MIDGDILLLEVGGKEKKSIVAFDKKTGETRWTALDGPAGSSSPLLVKLGDKRQYVFARVAGAKIFGMADQGEELWSYPIGQDTICMPLFVPPNRFFISSAQLGNGGTMIQVNKNPDGQFEAEKIWNERRMKNHFNNSIYLGRSDLLGSQVGPRYRIVSRGRRPRPRDDPQEICHGKRRYRSLAQTGCDRDARDIRRIQ